MGPSVFLDRVFLQKKLGVQRTVTDLVLRCDAPLRIA